MIYGIGDLHFDSTGEKPMDIFGDNWLNHEEQIMENWESKVKEDDLVLLPGDISWALKLKEGYLDLERIDKLPGKKIISKGNHDYWWESLNKMNNLGLKSIFFLHNNFYQHRNVSIHGTRGWMSRDSDEFKESDEKIFTRELLRLRMSLDLARKAKPDKKIVMLHYPPFNNNGGPNEFVDIMKEFDVDICVYGHLHAEGHRYAIEGEIEGIEFFCIASDYINFDPKIIVED